MSRCRKLSHATINRLGKAPCWGRFLAYFFCQRLCYAADVRLNVPEPESSIQIHGDGLVVKDGSSDEVFESTFQIADPGTGKVLGLKPYRNYCYFKPW